MRRGRTWPWIEMRPFLARFSEPVWSGHLPSWADFITTTPELKFSVHTALSATTASLRRSDVESQVVLACSRRSRWTSRQVRTHPLKIARSAFNQPFSQEGAALASAWTHKQEATAA